MSSTDPTYTELLAPGELGDLEIDCKMTARQLAAIWALAHTAAQFGVARIVRIAAESEGVGEEFDLAFREAAARMGLAMARVLGNEEHSTGFAVDLALLDQKKAGQ